MSTEYKQANSQGGSHMVHARICAYLLKRFYQNWYSDGWVFIRDKGAQIKNWVYFEQIIAKNTQFEQNWVLFYQKWYTDVWVIG